MISQLRSRKSIRKYKNTPLDPQIMDLLKEAVLLSPSSRGINPWEFIFITDPQLLSTLSKAKMHGSGFLAKAPLAIVVCGKESSSDVWVEDCSIASIIAHLTAHSIGLGSCWIQIRNRNHNANTTSESFIREVLQIPSDIRVESIIAIGFPDEDTQVNGKPDYSKIHLNRF